MMRLNLRHGHSFGEPLGTGCDDETVRTGTCRFNMTRLSVAIGQDLLFHVLVSSQGCESLLPELLPEGGWPDTDMFRLPWCGKIFTRFPKVTQASHSGALRAQP